jgi:hypothetical protein
MFLIFLDHQGLYEISIPGDHVTTRDCMDFQELVVKKKSQFFFFFNRYFFLIYYNYSGQI